MTSRFFIVAAMIAPVVAAASAHAQDRQLAAAERMVARDAVDQLRRADLNQDGAISRAEVTQFRTTQWRRLDRNGDGVFYSDDLPAFARGKWNSERLAAMRAQFDGNRDGRITRQEFVEGPTVAFDLGDANHDGLLTQAEMRALQATYGG